MRMRLALLAAFPLHVIPGFEEHRPRGHYATWLPQLAEAFGAERDLEVHWLVTVRQRVDEKPVEWQGQQFHRISVPRGLRPLRGYFEESAAHRRCLDRIEPQLVHAWGTEEGYGLAGARCGRPWLLSLQGILQEYVRRVRMPLFFQVQALYEKLVLRRARQITAESPWATRVAARLAPHAVIHRVEYGVPPFFYQLRWEPDPKRPRAIYIGTEDRRKGVADAVAAFADPQLQHAELELIGDLEGLAGSVPPNVRWLGRLSQEETAERLRRAWCLVLPTRADTGPTVVKEARVIGLPVVTTPHGGQGDYIVHGENGFLCEPGDTRDFAEKLTAICGNFTLTRELGETHWAAQRELFRPQHTATRFLELYRELLGVPEAPVS